MRKMAAAAGAAVMGMMQGRRGARHDGGSRRVLRVAAALLLAGFTQPVAAASIGPGNPPSGPGGGTPVGGGGTTPIKTTYTTTLVTLLGSTSLPNASANPSVDQLLADITKGMRDVEATAGGSTPRPAFQIDTLTAFITSGLECTSGTRTSCSSSSFVPGQFAGGLYALIVAGCDKAADVGACIDRSGQIDLSCVASVAAICAVPGTPALADLVSSGASALQVRSYANGSLGTFVQPPVAPGGTTGQDAGVVPEPATWAMMLIGFALIGAASRWRRQRTSVSC